MPIQSIEINGMLITTNASFGEPTYIAYYRIINIAKKLSLYPHEPEIPSEILNESRKCAWSGYARARK